MVFGRALLFVVLAGLVIPSWAYGQQTPQPPRFAPRKDMGALDQVLYQKEAMEEYRRQLERQRRLREMEAWDSQRRLVKRELLNVRCVWKRPGGKTITRTFERRIAPSCADAIAELGRDLGRPLSADCSCTRTSPSLETP